MEAERRGFCRLRIAACQRIAYSPGQRGGEFSTTLGEGLFMREPNWKRLALILGLVAVLSSACAGYWYRQANDRVCPWCQQWHDMPSKPSP